MRHSRRHVLAAVSLGLICLAAGPSTGPSTRPAADWWTSEYGFCHGFRCSHYLHLAADLQQLDPDRRVKRLREMAADAGVASELFPLCRMLFARKPGGEFRRPTIGGGGFVGGRGPFDRDAHGKWPLDPITLHDEILILVSDGTYFVGGGRPEEPAAYLEYCLAKCVWTRTKFADADPAHVREAVEAFIAATPDLSADDVTRLRQQAE